MLEKATLRTPRAAVAPGGVDPGVNVSAFCGGMLFPSHLCSPFWHRLEPRLRTVWRPQPRDDLGMCLWG